MCARLALFHHDLEIGVVLAAHGGSASEIRITDRIAP